MKIICVVPIYNEESRLKYLLEEIIQFKKIYHNEVEFLLVNSGSTDNSENILKMYKFNYLSLKRNKGIGYVLLLGLKLAHKKGYDILIHMAGNFKMSPLEIPTILNPIVKNNIDYVSGSRFLERKNYVNNPFFRKASIRILSKIISFFFKTNITDATCGFRAFKIKKIITFYKDFNKKKYYTYGYEYYSYGKILLSKNFSNTEVSVKMNYPENGKYSKIRPFVDWYKIIFGYFEALLDKKKYNKENIKKII